MSLTEEIQRIKNRPSLWAGPEEDGITFSLLSRFLQCRERFRVLVVDGLRTVPEFNHRIEYGQMWHTMEQAHLDPSSTGNEAAHLQLYCRQLCEKYPMQRGEIDRWYNVCRIQFPIYVEYWSKHPDTLVRKPMLQEKVFDLLYPVPPNDPNDQSRLVRLRGKWDSVDGVTSGPNRGIWLQENKTKGDIDVLRVERQLTFDLQTMLYVVALKRWLYDHDLVPGGKVLPVVGVRYNVVRRPLSGGKGSITQGHGTKGSKCPKCKGVRGIHCCPKCHGQGRIGGRPPESDKDFYKRLGEAIRESADTFFMRWNVPITDKDVARFEQRFLVPCLQFLCAWWDHIKLCRAFGPKGSPFGMLHWQHPFGVRNALDEGGHTDLDNYLETGIETGLVRADKLFNELT